ncbi:hypothetical protein ACFSQU_16550 [Massilia sp. GCM10020059]|uniref:Lipoprotein n=1 Tax=Massilia agrisoli TaxID=2892444 RepID=A0ABS8IV73_9BURK|nr:hypothetical protein [Massilia agrisoli]MCC6071149.1 hypothetical protein [Massilia agrisoli]
MLKQESSKQRVRGAALAAAIALASVLGGCREAPAPAAPTTVAADPAANRTREQAMSALMALPELQAWSSQLEKASGGKVRGALIEYDSAPRVIKGKNYWQFSFVENGSDAAHPWESFLVSKQDDEILVEDFGTDTPMTLEQWRKEKRPMERTSGEMIGE